MMALCEEMVDIETIVARGYEREEVARASRRCSALNTSASRRLRDPKMNALSFGRERRLPLTSGLNPQSVFS